MSCRKFTNTICNATNSYLSIFIGHPFELILFQLNGSSDNLQIYFINKVGNHIS